MGVSTMSTSTFIETETSWRQRSSVRRDLGAALQHRFTASPLIPPTNEPTMRQSSPDLTIPEVLSDPLIRAVMRADRVERRELEALLVAAARRLEAGRGAEAPPTSPRRFEAGLPRVVRGICE